MGKELGDSQTTVARISPKNKAGNAAAVESGSTNFSADPAGSVEITKIDDNSASIKSLGVLGDVTVSVSADADIGDGVQTISDSGVLTVIAGPASNLGLAFDEPTDTPPTTP